MSEHAEDMWQLYFYDLTVLFYTLLCFGLYIVLGVLGIACLYRAKEIAAGEWFLLGTIVLLIDIAYLTLLFTMYGAY